MLVFTNSLWYMQIAAAIRNRYKKHPTTLVYPQFEFPFAGNGTTEPIEFSSLVDVNASKKFKPSEMEFAILSLADIKPSAGGSIVVPTPGELILTDDGWYRGIGKAIRTTFRTTNKYLPKDMANAINTLTVR